MSATVVQFTDTHVSAPGELHFGIDTGAYLADAIAFVNAMTPAPDYVVVTGDLVDGGDVTEYERFVSIMRALRRPYVVIPGNHDEPERLRAILPAETYCDARTPRIRFAFDDFEVRLIGLDVTRRRPWMGASVADDTLPWLASALRAQPQRPTILAVHQPPFRSGLHYLDAFGFAGAKRLRRLLEGSPNVGRVICGHIHCVKTQRWGEALVTSAPSTAPQFVPELFERHVVGLRYEMPGFAVHRFEPNRGFATTYFRREPGGTYAPGYGEKPAVTVTAARARERT